VTDEFLSPPGPDGSRLGATLNADELEQVLTTAHHMADAAGRAIVPHFRALAAVENKLEGVTAEVGPGSGNGYDPVTVADRSAEEAMRQVLEKERPHDGIYGEEFGYQSGESGFTWVLDPIDGTRGFVCGLPTWGTLIALHNGQRSILGMMDQPVLQERFVGLVGDTTSASLQTRTTDAQAINCRGVSSLEESLLCITTPDIFTGDKHSQYLKLTNAVASTRYGTDCYGYAMLASGHIDLVVEPGLQPYDIQAMVPIIEAAGGVVTDWGGEAIATGGDVIAAANETLHQQVLALLN